MVASRASVSVITRRMRLSRRRKTYDFSCQYISSARWSTTSDKWLWHVNRLSMKMVSFLLIDSMFILRHLIVPFPQMMVSLQHGNTIRQNTIRSRVANRRCRFVDLIRSWRRNSMLPKATFPAISIVHPGEARVRVVLARDKARIRSRATYSADLGDPFAGDTRNRRSRHQLGVGGIRKTMGDLTYGSWRCTLARNYVLGAHCASSAMHVILRERLQKVNKFLPSYTKPQEESINVPPTLCLCESLSIGSLSQARAPLHRILSFLLPPSLPRHFSVFLPSTSPQ